MEKAQDTHIESKYSLKKNRIWANSLDEGNLLFTGVKPSLKELDQEVLKKAEVVGFSNCTEGNIFKTFAGKAAPIFNKGNLVYNIKENKWYKVLNLKTDEDYNPTFASLSLKDDESKRKDISKKSEFEEFKNCLKIYVNINKEGAESITIEVSPKIYDKFELALEAAFEGAGQLLMSYKLFYKGKEILKDQNLSNLDNIQNGDTIYASEGFGKPFKFNRFPIVYTSYGWSNCGNNPDGIMFIPNQNIKVCGFSTFAARSKDNYEMRYRVRIDGSDVEEETINASGWEDEYYYRHRLNGVYNAPAGSKIEFTCWIAENLSSHSCVETYYGDDG